MTDAPDGLLAYWFGAVDGDGPMPRERYRLWFGSERSTDDEVRRSFGDALTRARVRRWDGWSGPARERLAWIILLDQVSRHVYRGSPCAYAQDAAALDLCRTGCANGDAGVLSTCEKLFFGMPLQHAEDVATQQMSVEYFDAVVGAAPAQLRASIEMFRLQARRHRRVIERFGRFPQRNAILGRASTPEEISHLASAPW